VKHAQTTPRDRLLALLAEVPPQPGHPPCYLDFAGPEGRVSAAWRLRSRRCELVLGPDGALWGYGSGQGPIPLHPLDARVQPSPELVRAGIDWVLATGGDPCPRS